MNSSQLRQIFRVACVGALLHGLTISQALAQLTIEIKDYVTMPITGLVDGKGSNDGLLARVNTLREEPGGANRFFITDLNGPIYILDLSLIHISEPTRLLSISYAVFCL